MRKLNILFACEHSGIWREAFSAHGHDCTSIDLLPTSTPGNHIQDDVLKYLDQFWDCIIAFPPCTYLTDAANGTRFFKDRPEKTLEALDFVLKIWRSPAHFKMIENPKGLISRIIAPYDQILHPYYFGYPQLKLTCLWLKNLPLLKYSKFPSLFEATTATPKPRPTYYTSKGRPRYFTDSIPHTKNAGHLRSIGWPGMAKAAAAQWSEFWLSQVNLTP